MANAFEQKFRQIGERLRSGPAGSFFRWWINELGQAMPASWQQKLQHALRRVVLKPAVDSLIIAVDANRVIEPLQTLSPGQDITLQKQQVIDLLTGNDLLEAPSFLLLDLDEVLNRELSLPLAAESNLKQVLQFEMDRQTPFKASDVYYDWKSLGRGGDSGQLRLALFVVPRPEVDQAVKFAQARGFALTGVDVADGNNALGLNLLPYEQRARSVNRKSRLNYILAAAVVILLALVMSQSLYLKSHQVTELEEAIAEVRGEARSVTDIKQQIEDVSEAAGFLALRRAESPLSVEVLNDITRILPDDTYLDRLVINKASVQMQGKSQNAQRLIELANESALFDAAAFRGSTRLDARSGLEIFEVNAQIVQAAGD
jgi:general secretion pathway protein L